jgi:predicted transposase/invertase (TIGR01784 family)
MKFADPKNDIAFKKIFGDENHTEVLISFLNAVLDFNDNKAIKSVTIVNPYQVPKIEDLKDTILDIKATNQDDEEFIVEMQVQKDKYFAKRSLYYTSKSYVNQNKRIAFCEAKMFPEIKTSENYYKLKKVYFIGILDFSIFETDNYISQHLILDSKTNIQELKDFEFTFIELEKFNLELNDCNSLAQKLIYFIKNAKNLEIIPNEFNDIDEFKTAFDNAKMFVWNKDELEVYDYISMQIGKKRSELQTAKEDGKFEGRLEGEKNKAVEIAKNLLDILDNETIALKTGLEISTIELLRE